MEIEPKTTAKASVIWLHGLGARADDFISIIPRLKIPEKMAIRFVFPQAPVQPVTLNQGYEMPAWYDLYGLSLDSKQDERGIRKAESSIANLIAREIERGITADKIVLIGFSQGGAMVLHTALRFPQKLAGVMALSSYLPLADFLTEEKSNANQQMPIFIAHGKSDRVLPIVAGELTREYLVAQEYRVDYHVYDMAHEVCLQEITDISNWLQQVLQ
jgi:phospholipase/carboxylesterase